MTVSFKAPLKSAVVNAAFMSRTSDTSTTGKVALSNSLSGTNIINLQQYINEIKEALGLTGEGDATANDYTEQNYITNGDSYKVAIDKLDQALKDISDIIEDGEIFLKSYSNDSLYEIANGTPPYADKTGIYFNSTTGKIRYYDSVGASWEDVGSGSGGGGIGYQEFLGVGDGVTTSYVLTNLPTAIESIVVFQDYMAVPKSEWTYTQPNLIFNTAPDLSVQLYVFYISDGVTAFAPIGAGTLKTEYHTLTLGELTAKQFNLSFTPSDSTVVLCDVVGGTTQIINTDFSVSSNIFDFDGLGLDGVLNTGDILRIHYVI
jgi:hypothetical protein